MAIFKSATELHARNLADQAYYEIAAEELAKNAANRGIYAQAIAMSKGESARIPSIYIALRVDALKIEAAAIAEMASEYEKAEPVAPPVAFPPSASLGLKDLIAFIGIMVVIYLIAAVGVRYQ